MRKKFSNSKIDKTRRLYSTEDDTFCMTTYDTWRRYCGRINIPFYTTFFTGKSTPLIKKVNEPVVEIHHIRVVCLFFISEKMCKFQHLYSSVDVQWVQRHSVVHQGQNTNKQAFVCRRRNKYGPLCNSLHWCRVSRDYAPCCGGLYRCNNPQRLSPYW